MSQYHQEQMYGQPGVDPYQEQTKLSVMAVISLICSLICCLPTTLLGVLFGVFALVSIGSNPMKRGKGIALAGIILGVVFTAGQGFFWYSMVLGYAVFRDAPYHALAPGFQGDYAGMRAMFGVPGGAATDEEAKAFIDELRARYGELQGAEIAWEAYSNMQQPAPGSTAMSLPWVLVFDSGRVDADLTFSGDDQVQGSQHMIFRDITVYDATDGDLTFPPSAGASRVIDEVGDMIEDAADEMNDGN